MRLTSFGPADRRAMTVALRRGEPIHLDLDAAFVRGYRGKRNMRLDEIVPLCASVDVTDAETAAAVAAIRAPAGREDGTKASPRVTAVIPCSGKVPLGLGALLAQDLDVRVLILSNGGGPTEVIGADVMRVEWKGHGPTRAAALEHVDTEYVFFTVDDAIPMGAGCLRLLVEALDSDAWDAAIARQIPWPDAGAVTASRLRRWTPPGDAVVPTPQTDHVATMYRTETLREHPIPLVPIAEDAWWSRERRVAYVPRAPVLHSHERTPAELFQRNRAIHRQLVEMGHSPTIPTAGALVRSLVGVLRPTLSAGPSELLNQVAEITGQWRGAADVKR